MFVQINVVSLILVFITMILATIISLLTMILIGEIPFFIEDANQIYWIYSKIILIFGLVKVML